jgi:hypothetical protein
MNLYPSAADLLRAVADLLDDEVMPAVPAELAHKVRVASNLARIVGRECELSAPAAEAERRALAGLLGHEGELAELRSELSARLRHGDLTLERDAWQVAVEVTRQELAVVKPGHDRWEGK